MHELQESVSVYLPGTAEPVPGKIVARSFCTPPRYDIMVAGEIMQNVSAEDIEEKAQ